jgi:hypothetical protein
MVALPEIAFDDTIRTTALDVLPPAMGQQFPTVQTGWAPWIIEDPRALGVANAAPTDPIAIKYPPVLTGPPVQGEPPGTVNPTNTATTNQPVTGVAWPTRQWGAIRPVMTTGGQAVQRLPAQSPAPTQALTPNQTLNLAGTVAGIPVWAIGAVVVVGFLFLMGGKK